MKKYLAVLFLALIPAFAFAGGHGASGMGWFGTTVVSSLIHGLIYGVIFKLFHSLGLVPSLVIAAAGIGGAYLYYRKANQNR